MLLLGHLGLPLAAAEIAEKALPSLRGKIDYRLVIIGSFLPDLVDKPVGMLLFANALGSGRIFAHTLLFSLLLLLLGWLRWRQGRSGVLILALAALGHQLSDELWKAPQVLFWPAYGWDFGRFVASEPYLQWLAHKLISIPSVYIPEIIGGLLFLRFAIKLLRCRQLRMFLLSGRPNVRPWPK